MKGFKRPILKIPLSPLEKVLEIISLSGIGAIMINLYIGWSKVPERLPTHFGPSGYPDGWG